MAEKKDSTQKTNTEEGQNIEPVAIEHNNQEDDLATLLPLVIALILSGFTGYQIHKISLIRDWLPGTIVQEEVILEKWHELPRSSRYADQYWVRIDDGNIQYAGNHRLDLPEKMWAELKLGESLEIVRIPGDEQPYLRNGNVAANGELIRYSIFFLLGLFVAFVMLKRLFFPQHRNFMDPLVDGLILIIFRRRF